MRSRKALIHFEEKILFPPHFGLMLNKTQAAAAVWDIEKWLFHHLLFMDSLECERRAPTGVHWSLSVHPSRRYSNISFPLITSSHISSLGLFWLVLSVCLMSFCICTCMTKHRCALLHVIISCWFSSSNICPDEAVLCFIIWPLRTQCSFLWFSTRLK